MKRSRSKTTVRSNRAHHEPEQVLRILGKPKSTPLNRAFPSDLAVANKSGGMERVRCDVGIVFLPNRPYAIAVTTKLGL